MAERSLGRDVLVGVITAAVIGGGTLIWNWASQGGLIRILGGLPAGEVDRRISSAVENIQPTPDPPGEPGAGGPTAKDVADILAREGAIASATLPAGAVIASTVSCTDMGTGWQRYEEASSRFIIGAATENDLNNGPARFRLGENDEPLKPRVLEQPGGVEMVRIENKNMPTHTHVYTLSPNGSQVSVDKTQFFSGSSNAPTVSGGGTRHPYSGRQEFDTRPQGGGEPLYNMPPYIALYFCVKRG